MREGESAKNIQRATVQRDKHGVWRSDWWWAKATKENVGACGVGRICWVKQQQLDVSGDWEETKLLPCRPQVEEDYCLHMSRVSVHHMR